MYNNNVMLPTLNSSASPGGGRFDFDDGGTYCGGWQDGKAHGHGVCTGPKGLGEYSGSWDFGFEVSGVYKWQNGAVYEGKWQNGKRHGVGVEYNGKWIYKGEWTQGYKGRYGVRSSSITAVKYEGTWANGLQDGYGWETYADGGSYQGQWCRGTRHGYGVRASAPYGFKNSNNQQNNSSDNDNSNIICGGSNMSKLNRMSSIHGGNNQMSNQSSSMMDFDDEPFSNEETRPTTERLKASNNGFVLVAKTLEPTPSTGGKYGDKNSRRSSMADKSHSRIPGTHTTASLLRGLHFKKQRSTSDLDTSSGRHTPGSISIDSRRPGQGSKDYEISLSGGGSHQLPLALSPEELDINDPSTVETYMGEWKQDKRSGHGVCERSDGLKYEGQWHNDMKCGYGITTHRDGTKEEGKYKNNILVVDSKVKKIFQLRGANLRQKIDEAVELANQAQEVALKKADIAITRAATSRDKAEQATEKAAEALKDSRIAHSVAKQYSDNQAGGGGSGLGGTSQMAGAGGMVGPLHASILAGGMGIGGGFENQLRRRLSYFAHHHGGPGMKSGGMHDIHHQSEYDEHNNNQQRLYQQQHHHEQVVGDASGQNTHHQLHQQSNPPEMNHHPHPHPHPHHSSSLGPNEDGSSGGGGGGELDGHHQSTAYTNPSGQLGPMRHHTTNQKYLGPLEPFGGRRGSFRMSASGGGHGIYLNNPASHHHHHQQHHHHTRSDLMLQTDPFNDHFDHYRSNPATTNNSSFDSGHSITTRGRFLKKQTSFDQTNLRQYNNNNNQNPSHARFSSYIRRNSVDLNPINDQQHQLAHLVTSGEELLASMAAGTTNIATTTTTTTTNNNNTNTNTNTNDLQTGRDSSGTPHGNPISTLYGSQGSSPSPLDPRLAASSGSGSVANNNNNGSIFHHQSQLTNRLNHPMYPSQQQQQQQQHHYHNLGNNSHQGSFRGGSEPRQTRHYGLQRQTTVNNYDFSISTPTGQTRTRRTASLTRHPIMPSSNLNLFANNDIISTATTSRAGSTLAMTGGGTGTNHGSMSSINARTNAMAQNHQPNPFKTNEHTQTSSGLGVSGLNLSRKPSLQVRYDPQALGGIMSREEVAALSHAQREQRRLEAELADRKRRNPLLYFILAAKELIYRQKLGLTVLMVNIVLFFIFADLLT